MKIHIVGGGIAGVSAALELAEAGYEVEILEARDQLLRGSSDNTPCRVGVGLHYIDSATAKEYLRNTIQFLRRYKGYLLEVDEALIGSDYVVTPDSQHPYYELAGTHAAIVEEYKRLITEDPENKLLGEPDGIIQMRPDTPHVNPLKKQGAYKTVEQILDWPRLRVDLIQQVAENSRISVRYDTTVSAFENSGSDVAEPFTLTLSTGESIPAEEIVNCAWQNTEKLNTGLNIPYHEERTCRLKGMAEIQMPVSLQDMRTTFFCFGAHCAITNTGDGKAFVTWEPVTNMQQSTELTLPEEMNFWAQFGSTLESKPIDELSDDGSELEKDLKAVLLGLSLNPERFNVEIEAFERLKERAAALKEELRLLSEGRPSDDSLEKQFLLESLEADLSSNLVAQAHELRQAIGDKQGAIEQKQRLGIVDVAKDRLLLTLTQLKCQLVVLNLYRVQIENNLKQEDTELQRDNLLLVHKVMKSVIGQLIIHGAATYINGLEKATLINVSFGIVKTPGKVDIHSATSGHHVRTDCGIKDNSLGVVTNQSMKLLYGAHNASEVVRIVDEHCRKAELLAGGPIVEGSETIDRAMKFYVSRYHGAFFRYDDVGDTDTAEVADTVIVDDKAWAAFTDTNRAKKEVCTHLSSHFKSPEFERKQAAIARAIAEHSPASSTVVPCC